MKFLLTVITPTIGKVPELTQLVRDFYNQTLPKGMWEHIIIYDGVPDKPEWDYLESLKKDPPYNLKWLTGPAHNNDLHEGSTVCRNVGTILSKSDYVYYADSDDRYRSDVLETLLKYCDDHNGVGCIQMTCSDSRMFRGDPKHWNLVPEVGTTQIKCCHFGTPCLIYKREWALQRPWLACKDHDFIFARSIIDLCKPRIMISHGMRVDCDGLVVRNLRDWLVSLDTR